MMRRLGALCHGEEGSYTVEVALIMPVFVLLLFGFISTSLLLFVYCEATYAAQAAVRYASLRSTFSTASTAAGVQTLVTNLMIPAGGGSLQTPTVSYAAGNAIGTGVSVTVQVNYPVSLPFLPMSSITLSSTAQSLILY